MTGKEERKKKSNSKAWKYAVYVVGSAALCAAYILIMEKIYKGELNKDELYHESGQKEMTRLFKEQLKKQK